MSDNGYYLNFIFKIVKDISLNSSGKPIKIVQSMKGYKVIYNVSSNRLYYRTLICRVDWFFCYFGNNNNDSRFSRDKNVSFLNMERKEFKIEQTKMIYKMLKIII